MLKRLAARIRRLHTRIRSRRQGRTGTAYTLTYDSAGLQLSWLTLENETGRSSCGWDQVQSIFVYKRDLYVTDLICAVFVISSTEAIEVHEEMAGWQPLVESLPEHLPGSAPFATWWQAVAVPAFAPNARVIYQRSPPPAV